MSRVKFQAANCWSEHSCAGGALQQGNVVTSICCYFLFLSFQLITRHVVVVVKLPSQAGTDCERLYTNVYIHSHQIVTAEPQP
jgi:hypothetical protein